MLNFNTDLRAVKDNDWQSQDLINNFDYHRERKGIGSLIWKEWYLTITTKENELEKELYKFLWLGEWEKKNSHDDFQC